MKLLSKFIHVNNVCELERKEVSLQIFKYVTYDIDGVKERKKIKLVSSQVCVCEFMKDFLKNTRNYVQHVHVSQWKDENFRICRDTFPVGTM
jgi:hypothetical protein